MDTKKIDDRAKYKSSAVPLLMEWLLEKGYGPITRVTRE
jgi:hypothetical protein